MVGLAASSRSPIRIMEFPLAGKAETVSLRVLCRLHRSIRKLSGTLGDSLESLLMSSRAVSMWRLGAIPIMGRDVYAKAVKEK